MSTLLAQARVSESTSACSVRTVAWVALLAATASWIGCGRSDSTRAAGADTPRLAGVESPSPSLVDGSLASDPVVTAFASEPDAEKRIDMIEGVLARGPCKEAELAMLVLATDSRQPRAVRVAAIDVLSEIDDPRVATVLHVMKADPDSEVRELAAEALEELEDQLEDLSQNGK